MRAIDIALPGPGEGQRVSRAQHLRLADEVEGLTEVEWRTVTECPAWSVFDMVAHVTSAARFRGNPLLFVLDAQVGRVRYRGRSSLDAANEVGIDRLRGKAPEALVELLRRRSMSTRDTPGLLRRKPVNDAALPSYATIGYFVDCILTRDVWLHRHDIARALGREPQPEATDPEIVEQVVRDLGVAWSGPPIRLELTGPEGGSWTVGAGEATQEVRLPAVEFMRHLSGRAVDPDLFGHTPNSVHSTLQSARIVF